MPQSALSFDDLFEAAQHSAVHLEMRDQYAVGDEADDFNAYLATGHRDVDPASAYWAPWTDMISRAVARGVTVRRARIVSEPVTDYIRYEHAGTVVNVAAGEQVRWLPRRHTVDLLVPSADLWIFDGTRVLFNHFTGDGNWANPDMELRTEVSIAKQCADAFEAIWDRAVPHDQYEIH